MIDSNGRIGLGIVGASARRGWAKFAHIPAIIGDRRFALTAISASGFERANEAARAYGVDLAFADHQALVERPEVDVVVVSVKAPDHHAVVSAAIEAGKHIYCEWPLGRTLAESEDLAAKARRRGIATFIGLQARSSPAVRYLRRLQAEGRSGRRLGVTMHGRVPAFGPVTDLGNAYINNRGNGANLLTISFAHSIDALCWSLGEIDNMSSMLAIRHPSIKIEETGEMIERTSPDQVLVTGSLPDGAPVSVHFEGGGSPLGNFDWAMAGSECDFGIYADDGNLQISRATLRAAKAGEAELTTLAIPTELCPAPSAPAGPAYNMSQVYARMAEELSGSGTAEDRLPDFDAAVHRHTMIAEIERIATRPRG